MSQKGNSWIYLLLLIAIIGVVFAFLKFTIGEKSGSGQITPKNALTPQLSLYQSKELGFEFSYPAQEMAVVEDTEDAYSKRQQTEFRKNFAGYVGYQPATVIRAFNVINIDEKDLDKAPLQIWVFNNKDNLNAINWYKEYWFYPFVWGDFTFRRNETAPTNIATISGQVASYATVNYQPDSPKFTYISNKGRMFLIKEATTSATAAKIIQSLKF